MRFSERQRHYTTTQTLYIACYVVLSISPLCALAQGCLVAFESFLLLRSPLPFLLDGSSSSGGAPTSTPAPKNLRDGVLTLTAAHMNKFSEFSAYYLSADGLSGGGRTRRLYYASPFRIKISTQVDCYASSGFFAGEL